MKKRYVIPQIDIVRLQNESPLAASGVTANNNIGYGGVDEEGELEPSVKLNDPHVQWESWEEWEKNP